MQVRFASETGVGAARAAVRNYQLLMKDLAAPLDAVMTAPDVPKLGAALNDVFDRLRKLKYADRYPLAQAFRLVEAVSCDLARACASVLRAAATARADNTRLPRRTRSPERERERANIV